MLSLIFKTGTNNAKGVSSGQFISTSSQLGQSLTISSDVVSFAASTGFAVAAAAPNSTMVKIGSFTLQTGSAEGVTVSNIALTFPVAEPETLL